MGAGDFNGDGKADILAQNNDGEVAVALMNGTTITGVAAIGNPGAGWHAVGADNFAGPGQSDILLQNTDGAAQVWLLSGTTITQEAILSPNPGSTWHLFSG